MQIRLLIQKQNMRLSLHTLHMENGYSENHLIEHRLKK